MPTEHTGAPRRDPAGTEPPAPVADTYRPTLLDRVGPDAALLWRSLGWSGLIAVLGMFFGALAALTRGASFAAVAGWSLRIGVAAGVLSLVFTLVMSRGMSAGFLAFIQPSGASGPAESQFSYQQALAARGDVAAAIASYEDLLRVASPKDIPVRLRAADLYVDFKTDARRAAELYREVQRVPTVPPTDYVYATNRLISLYLGVLADRGKAMGELRRLIDLYPDSQVASHARTALANLKREIHGEGQQPT